MHVIIIGGGIGGLCLAQGLRNTSLSVAVYERDRTPDARRQGYRINIEAMGSAALRACLPPHLWNALVDTAGDPGPGMGVFDEQLRQLAMIGSAEHSAPGEHAVSRVTLRDLLLSGLDDVVHFGKEFVRYEHTADGRVTAWFADGTSATGDLLVGADGSRSRVRQQLLPHAHSVDAAALGIGGKLPLTDATAAWLPPRLMAGKNMVLPRRDFLFTAVFRQRKALTSEDDYIMWAFVAHRSAHPTDTTPHAFVRRRAAAWHTDLQRLLAETDPATVQRFGFTASAPVKPWRTTTVTLLGDAIHHMPPVGGLGGNAALRDADRLRTAITAVRSRAELVEALRAYEADMLATGFAAVGESMRNLRVAIQGRPGRVGARAFFRVCGSVPRLQRAVFGH